MRIGMLADMYTPHVSGVTNYIRLNARTLKQSGHDVFIFTFGDPEKSDAEENVIRSPGVPVADTGVYFAFSYTRPARRLIRTMDVVHAHHPFLSGRLALRYCRPYNIPVVYTNHTRYDLYAQAYLPVLPDQVGTSFLHAYMPSFCREVDLVIAPSPGMKTVLEGIGVEAPIRVIPNGVDLDPYRKPIEPFPREQLGVYPDDVLLVFVGRLGPEKNLTFLLRSFAGAQSAYPNTSLLLVGDGPEMDNLKHLSERFGLADRIRFTGMVDYDLVSRYLAAADAFVTASVTEVHPLSVIEAMASGLPVLGIESPGVSDSIIDGENGFLSRDELASFTAMLTRLVADGESRKRMAENARRSAEAYDVRRTSEVVEGEYMQLISRAPRRELRTWRMGVRRLIDRFS
ncbi:MAG TPA: glycosyltransferase [Anaerolineales bacterium]|nr:glycosyltransferase [Anaerolineales bacterium]